MTDFRVVRLNSVDSTNAEAWRRAGRPAEANLVVWARQQEQGRGRHGRDDEERERERNQGRPLKTLAHGGSLLGHLHVRYSL